MDPQVASIRRFIVWAVAWALTLTLVAGLFLWRSPMRAAGDALPTSESVPALVPADQAAAPESTGEYILYFPLMFNRGDPFLPAPGTAP